MKGDFEFASSFRLILDRHFSKFRISKEKNGLFGKSSNMTVKAKNWEIDAK
jgi:hypothetical protein